MTYSDTSKKATNKYRSKFDLIQISVKQGERQKIVEHAEAGGESLNAFVNRAISETMSNDRKKKES